MNIFYVPFYAALSNFDTVLHDNNLSNNRYLIIKSVLQEKTSIKKILIAPLDWGLGHTTRCMAIVKALEAYHCQITVAGNAQQLALFNEAFKGIQNFELQGYNIKYSKTKKGFLFSMALQVPKILKAIKHEKRWLRQLQQKERFDIIISDNRYGLYVSGANCIFITHQLQILAPFQWIEPLLRKLNYRFINRFNKCWVPDVIQQDNNLAGKLSHPPSLPAIPVHYVGPLSRFEKLAANTVLDEPYLFISISGPEPQRSIFEQKIRLQLQTYTGKVIVVRGLPGSAETIAPINNAVFFNHLSSTAFAAYMHKATYIICRSGYTTCMDIARLNKKAIFIATPGQTEQEYLAKLFMQRGWAVSYTQQQFQLEDAIKAAAAFKYQPIQINNAGLLENAVNGLFV